MAGIQETMIHVDAVVEILGEHQEANQEAQLAHNEALSYGEALATQLEGASDIPAAVTELEKACVLKGTVEEGLKKIITGVERGLKAMGGVDGHVRTAVEHVANTSLHLKDSAKGYSGLHQNLVAAKSHAHSGDQLAEKAAKRLQAAEPAQGSDLELVGRDAQTLAEEARTYHNDVVGEAKKTLKVRNGDSPRWQRIDTELETVVDGLTYITDKRLKGSRQKIEAALRLLREGLYDFATCGERLEPNKDKLLGSHKKIDTLESDVKNIVTLLGSERSTPQSMARSSAEIQEQAKQIAGSI